MPKRNASLSKITAEEAARIASQKREVSTFERHYNSVQDDDYDSKSASYDLVRDGTGDDNYGPWAPDVATPINGAILKSLFYSEDWVFILVDLIASKIASQELKVRKRVLVDGAYRVEDAEGHPVQSLVESPNAMQDYYEWMYGLIVDLILVGNSIQWRMKATNGMIGLPAESISLDFDNNGSVRSYVVSSMFEDEIRMRQRGLAFPAQEVIHIRRPNPGSILWGLSPFIPGRRSVLFNRFTGEYLNNFYQKGASPGIALEMDKEANEAVALRLLRSFEATYTGRRNQRRTLVLPKGVTAKQMGHTIADQTIVELVNSNRESTLALLKVPKHEVGLQTAGSLGSEEYKQALKNFWESTLKPTCRQIEGKLNKFLSKDLGNNYFLEFDLSEVEVLKDDVMAKANIGNALLQTHTVNEVRKKVFDEDPIPGGEVLRGTGPSFGGIGPVGSQPTTGPEGSQIAAENAVTTPTQALNGAQVSSLIEIVQNVANGTLDREAATAIIQVAFALSRENASAILGQTEVQAPAPNGGTGTATSPTGIEAPSQQGGGPNTVGTEAVSEAPQKSEEIRRLSKDHLTTILKSENDWFAQRQRKLGDVASKGMKAMETVSLRAFSDMAVTIVANTLRYLIAKGYDPEAVKATIAGNPKQQARLIGKSELRRRLRKAMDRLEERWVSDTRKALVAAVEAGYDAIVEVPFNLPSAAELQGIRVRNQQVRLDALADRESRAFQYLTETSLNQVFLTIENGIDKGLTVQQISDSLRSAFTNIDEIQSRAMTIARTETLTAVSLGQAAAMKDAAEAIPDLQKMWITAEDDRVRDAHQALEGEVQPWDQPFSNDLMFPRDPSGPAEEVINCRCTFIAVPEKQMADFEKQKEG